MSQNNRSKSHISYIGLVSILAIFIVGIWIFDCTHFWRNTTISGIDCSWLTLKEAYNKIEQEVNTRTIKFYFMDGNIYEETYEKIGVSIDEKKLESVFKEQHKYRSGHHFYNLGSVIELDQEKLKETLKTFPELQLENMIAPQNAQLTWNGEKFDVTREKVGNQIDLEEAEEFAIRQINAGMDSIYFQLVTQGNPDVVYEDIESIQKYMNNLLQSCLYFKLANGEIVTLDKNVIKTWIVEDARLGYSIDVESGIQHFVEMLAQKVKDINKDTPELTDVELNQDVETEIINAFLGNPNPQEVDLAYRKIKE